MEGKEEVDRSITTINNSSEQSGNFVQKWQNSTVLRVVSTYKYGSSQQIKHNRHDLKIMEINAGCGRMLLIALFNLHLSTENECPRRAFIFPHG